MCLSFRAHIPPHGVHPRLGDIGPEQHDAYTWVDHGLQSPMVRDIWDNWRVLYKEPFRGITTDGEVIPNLFHLRFENAPVQGMKLAADKLLVAAENDGRTKRLRCPIEANEWRCWMNPEFYLAKYGIRLEEESPPVRDAVLQVIEASLSRQGFAKVQDAMRINAFLGQLRQVPKIMNEWSYNFILFGEPSLTEPWGWSIWGHHLSACVFVLEKQMVVSPVFIGCEPNIIDVGSYAGTELLSKEMSLATRLMNTLEEDIRNQVILYDSLDHPDMPEGFPHPADGRNLAGAYEDNRVIPTSGAPVSCFSSISKQALLDLTESFINFVPDGPREAKMKDIKQHLDQSYFTWMGQYNEHDPFHFRFHSPVIICEFDHECGMWLGNQEPGRFHIHSLVRTPNGNDYGKKLLELWREKKSLNKI